MPDKTASIIGIDLGGTKIALSVFALPSMRCLCAEVNPTHTTEGFAHVRDDVVARIQACRREDTIAVGIGVPGLVDAKTGRVLTMPNIPGSEDAELQTFIGGKVNLPIVIENDAQCFAYAEAIEGAGKGHRVVVGITLGTGVGGGIVIDRELYRGAHGSAGEIGHMLLMPGSPPYATDDRRGEVEQFLSGSAMGKRCEAALDPTDYLVGAACSFMHPQVYREVAWLVANLTHSIDPSVIVFGGSAGKALKPHLEAINRELDRWTLRCSPRPMLAVGELPDAAVRGAALLALASSEWRPLLRARVQGTGE